MCGFVLCVWSFLVPVLHINKMIRCFSIHVQPRSLSPGIFLTFCPWCEAVVRFYKWMNFFYSIITSFSPLCVLYTDGPTFLSISLSTAFRIHYSFGLLSWRLAYLVHLLSRYQNPVNKATKVHVHIPYSLSRCPLKNMSKLHFCTRIHPVGSMLHKIFHLIISAWLPKHLSHNFISFIN